MRRKNVLMLALAGLMFWSLGVGEATKAEGLSLASVSYELIPSSEYAPDTLERNELNTTARTVTVKLAIPILLAGKNSILLNFFTLRSLYQTYENAEAAGILFRPDYLYTFKYGLVFRQVLSDKWNLAILAQPSLLTDLDNVGSDHVTIRAGFIFTKKVSSKFTYGIGAGYSDDFGQPIVLPVARLKWRPSHRWKLNFDVPQKLNVWYLMSSRLSLGIEGKVTGAQFRIGENVDIGNGRLTGDGLVKYSIFNLGPAVKIGLYDGLSLTVNGGRTLYRRFEVIDVDDNQLQDYQFETSYFLKARIGFSVGSD